MSRCPLAPLILAAIVAASASVAYANDGPEAPTQEEQDPPALEPHLEDDRRGEGDDAPAVRGEDVAPSNPRDAEPTRPINVSDSTPAPLGKEKTGVSSQVISVPKGSGKIAGMGESFSMELSTGIGTFSVPIAAPPARGAGDASLHLSYSSSRGPGVVGVGWGLPVPYIARESDRGVPRYDDPAPGGPWHDGQDRFVFGAGQELVPICLIGASGTCPGKLVAEVMPLEMLPGISSQGWQYFRARVEGAFLRFFWSPDHATWLVQAKSGVVLELGKPLDDPSYLDALERDPSNPTRAFRWNIVRQYDAQRELPPAQSARPVNLIAYRYSQAGGMAYLEHVYYTPPAVDAADADESTYAHHIFLDYEPRPDVASSYRRGWLTQALQRLKRVDVTSKPFTGGTGVPRELVRRIHLAYDTDPALFATPQHVSLLSSITVEGRCVAPDGTIVPKVEVSGALPLVTSCDELPPMTFSYEHVEPFDITGASSAPDLPGFEGFDDQVITIGDSPKYSLDGNTTDLFDVNGDALPDLLVTLPGFFQGKHGVFFLGDGVNEFGAQNTVAVQGVLGANAGVIALSNPNIAPLDADGDGIVDLLHMPKVKTYSVYEPRDVNGQWTWIGREVVTAAAQSPKIDFQQDSDRTRVMDVNGDGLVDVVFSGATEMQTFFNLGYRQGGDGQFGHIDWNAPGGPALSNDATTACRPWSATPVGFDDPDVVVGDMNGDGLLDIVRVRKGDIRYWPGRGNGFWGTGPLDDCTAGSFAVDRHIVMDDGPMFSQLDALPRLDDMNGDGFDDLVQIRFNAVDIWLNVDGIGWTADRHIIQGTPPVSPIENRVRLVDANGSGSRDILWGDGYSYQYIDPLGGARPWVLTKIENGLGKSTTIDYETSTQQMLEASPAWTKVMPTVAHVVARVTERDHLNAVPGLTAGEYITKYEYREPVYEGRQREFRGFTTVRARAVGDDDPPPTAAIHSPTSLTETTFLLGECKDETADAIDDCADGERWRDNPREALKGTPVLTETWGAANGKFHSTAHSTVRLRQLYVGLDGRVVRHAFARVSETYLYDVADFDGVTSTVVLDEVELGPVAPADTTRTVTLRSTAGRVKTRAEVEVDEFGNQTKTIAKGCIEGCVPADPTIDTVFDFDRPPGDTLGWLWRPVEAYVGAPGAERNWTFASYDGAGNPLIITATLSGTVPLDRSHAVPGAPVAPAPPGASANGSILIAQNVYDELGNAVQTSGPNGRCRAVQPDASYAELPVSETVFTGGCGAGALTATAPLYDRGLGVPTTAFDLHGEKTLIEYDGFGRVWRLFRPHPALIGQTTWPVASVEIEYHLTDDPILKPFSRIHTRNQDGVDVSDAAAYRETWSFVDGMGRVILALDEADPTAGDAGAWIASGRVERTKKGVVFKTCLPWFSNADPATFPLGMPTPTSCVKESFDAFGRVVQRWALGEVETALYVKHHALSQDAWDGEDFVQGPHFNTYASSRRDGHGRVVVSTERVYEGGLIKAREIQTDYLATGEPRVIKRVRVGESDLPVVRWLRYDTLGRRVLNVEPHTTKDFTADVNVDLTTTTMRAWRYAYNDAGDLVGTSDARGCGTNYHYDAAGRVLAEDYSPCLGLHQGYSSPNLGAQTGVEVLYHYDTPDPAAPAEFQDPTLLLGRLVSVSDRAARTVTRVDGRGRVTIVGRQVTKPGVPADDLASRYAPHWYKQFLHFDAADRPIQESTGAEHVDLLGAQVNDLGGGLPATARSTTVETSYSARGTVKSVGGSYLTLVASVTRAADGLVNQVVHGDAAATTTTFGYDMRRRLMTVQTDRGPPSLWLPPQPPPGYTPPPDFGGPPSTFQLVLQDDEFEYDLVDNPTKIRDYRVASEWPAGAKPVTRTVLYDDLYRIRQVDYEYAAGDDTWVSPFAHENATLLDADLDSRRARPSPHVSFDKRVLSEAFQYDWLGNTVATDDDAHGFYDRSLGTITNDAAAGKPYQLKSAAQATGPRKGHLDAAYDDAGNLTSLIVWREGPCLPSTATCSQKFKYEYDEVGRLADARRWDFHFLASVPDDATPTAARLSHAYDLNGQRVIKTAYPPAAGVNVHTLYVFPSFELRRAEWDIIAGDYERSNSTEVPYLVAQDVRLARAVYEDPAKGVPTYAEPPASPPKLHVFFDLGDHLGSASVVLDKATGELVERSTFQAYGSAESDYRPARWKQFREDYKFTGKEEDIEVGLEYFGFRHYAPALGRWASADPLTLHGLGADPNLYAYVHGRALSATDPLGLCEKGAGGACSGHVVPPHEGGAEGAPATAPTDLKRAEEEGRRAGMAEGRHAARFEDEVAEATRVGHNPGRELSDDERAGLSQRAGAGIQAAEDAWSSKELKEAATKGYREGLSEGYALERFAILVGGNAQFYLENVEPARGVGQHKPKADAKTGQSRAGRARTPPLSKPAIGRVGEAEARDFLSTRGYTNIRALQNASNQGIDLVAELNGQTFFFEVKASAGSAAPALKAAQQNITEFVTSRVSRAASGVGRWRNVSAALQADARNLAKQIEGGMPIKGEVIKVTGVGTGKVQITTTPWLTRK